MPMFRGGGVLIAEEAEYQLAVFSQGDVQWW